MQAFLDLGELLISTDAGAALEAFRTVSALLMFWFLYDRKFDLFNCEIIFHVTFNQRLDWYSIYYNGTISSIF